MTNLEKDMLETLSVVLQKLIYAELNKDTYTEIELYNGEHRSRFTSLTRWLTEFANRIAPNDKRFYLSATNLYELQEYFKTHDSKVISYKRWDDRTGKYRKCKMRITKSVSYTLEHQVVYISVYDIEDEIVSEDLEEKTLNMMLEKECESVGVISVKANIDSIRSYIPIGKSVFEYKGNSVIFFFDLTAQQFQMNYSTIVNSFNDVPIGNYWSAEISNEQALEIVIERTR